MISTTSAKQSSDQNLITPFYRKVLIDEFTIRKNRNPFYSLRAFARDLGISVTCISDVLASKRRLSSKNAIRMVEKLSLSPDQARQVLAESKLKNMETFDSPRYLKLEEETFRMIADWYHYAILSLARLRNNRGSPRWIANRLGISPLEARVALERLLRLNFIAVHNGKLIRRVKQVHCGTGFPSAALRQHQKQNLRLAQISLDRDPMELRENTSITMAIDPTLLPRARQLIAKFKDKISKVLERGRPKEVYVLSVHLFPLTHKKGEK